MAVYAILFSLLTAMPLFFYLVLLIAQETYLILLLSEHLLFIAFTKEKGGNSMSKNFFEEFFSFLTKPVRTVCYDVFERRKRCD